MESTDRREDHDTVAILAGNGVHKMQTRPFYDTRRKSKNDKRQMNQRTPNMEYSPKSNIIETPSSE